MSDSKSGAAAAIRPAASIVIVRDGKAGLEVFVLERHNAQGVAFAGATVFPGGKVDGPDGAAEWEELAPGTPTVPERRFWIAAVRETFEEAGLLLARPRGEHHLIDATTAHRLVATARHDDSSEEFAGMLRRENLTLAADHMVHFGHWITPTWAPKRFDTHFFLAAAPRDQLVALDAAESAEGVWRTPQLVLDETAAGKRTMVAVTRFTLELLATWPNVETALAEARKRRVVTVQPYMEKTANGKMLKIPPEAGYLRSEMKMDG